MASPSAHDGVTVALTVTTSSPTLSLSSSHFLEVFVRARIIHSTRPGRSVTIAADRSVFAGEGLEIGVLGSGLTSKHDPSRTINFGVIRPRYRDHFEGPSLAERGYRLLTIPGDGSDIVVPYQISLCRLFERSTLRPEDITHTWSQGGNYLCSFDERPTEAEIEEGNYILGGDVDKFEVEDQTGPIGITIIV